MLPAIGQNHPQSGNYAPLDSHLWADATYPLGAHYRGDSVTFAVYSKNASQILLKSTIARREKTLSMITG